MKVNCKKRPIIGVTLGDAAGIGPEIVAKTGAGGVLEECGHAVIIADERELRRGMEIAGASFPYVKAANVEEAAAAEQTALLDTKALDAYSFPMGEESLECGRNSALNVKQAIEYCLQGYFDGVCFGPNNKKMMKKAGFKLNGAIDLVSGFMGYTGKRGELSVLGNVWTARVTSHIPLMEVGAALTVEKILDAIHLLNNAQKAAGIEKPHIAVAALNPHAGEGGTCGMEEIHIISPAVEEAKKLGIHVEGPCPADTMFYNLFNGAYDSAVTLFHDQGQIAMKLRGFEKGTTVMGGLPYPVTTCSHGTAYDVAGKGIANHGAWESAYRLVCAMARG